MNRGIGSIYTLEAVGSMIGGAMTSAILVRYLDAISITAVFAVLNIAAALYFAVAENRPKFKFIALFLIIAILSMWPLGAIDLIKQYSLKKQWRGYNLIASKDSIYGNVAIVKEQENYSLFDNGLHLYTIPDLQSAENSSHLALLQHPHPESVLLIGGGIGGVAEEILKEPVKELDYVEPDPLIIKMSQKYLPESYVRALKDARVSIKSVDGRFYVKSTDKKYDCIIVRLGDPYTAYLNRYYTSEFFEEVSRILKEGGILSLSMTSSESFISVPLAEFLASIYESLKAVFPGCVMLPGDTAIFLASKNNKYIVNPKSLETLIKERSLDTKYVREYYLSSRLSQRNFAYIKKAVEDRPGVKPNHDFRPAAYYYGLIFWTTLFRDSAFSTFLRSISPALIWQGIGLIIIILALIPLFFKRSFKRAVLLAVVTGGFSMMAFQVLILLAFQAMYGYLFYQLGIILTTFMAGVAVGAVFATRATEKLGKERTFLIAVQGDFLLYSLILPVFLIKSGSIALFPVMSAVAGFIGGSQFPIAAKVLTKRQGDPGAVGGTVYAFDLIGSFFGAIFTGALFVPVLGIKNTCLAVALINLVILCLLALDIRIEE
jgi:spermidine synthase